MWGLNTDQLQAELSNRAKYLIVSAGVRYWEDAELNGVADADGKMPLRNGDYWCPVIRLEDGQVMDWPAGTVADIHYKVCDDGEYFLADEARQTFAKRNGYYVPDDLLCIGDTGFGDYIILSIGADGKIEGWNKPTLDIKNWRDPASTEPDDE